MDSKSENSTLKTILIVMLSAAAICAAFLVCLGLLKNRGNGRKKSRKADRERVKLIFSDNGSNGIYPELLSSIKDCCAAALDEEGIGDRAEVSLTVVLSPFPHRHSDKECRAMSWLPPQLIFVSCRVCQNPPSQMCGPLCDDQILRYASYHHMKKEPEQRR